MFDLTVSDDHLLRNATQNRTSNLLQRTQHLKVVFTILVNFYEIQM